LLSLSALDWDLLIRQGRRANLLARLAHLLAIRCMLHAVPEAPRQHLLSALCITERQTIAVRWEVECLLKAFVGAGVPLILLKGAACLMAGLPVSAGRVFSDIDIIVPKRLLGDAESALMQHGWRGTDLSAYDQRYYRQWMHEIPPMTHVRRGTTIDLHHSILPGTARVSVNAAALFEGVIATSHPGVRVLQPVDMLLHTAAHQYQERELQNGQRDLFDLDSLLRHFGTDPGFWAALVPRARTLGLVRPLHYAIRYTTTMLGTEVPLDVVDAAREGAPAKLVGRIMDFCYGRALRPVHPSCDDRWTKLARTAIYLRSHWIRMPLRLLVYHLSRKALLRVKAPGAEPAATAHGEGR
jgi:hypothetical protein